MLVLIINKFDSRMKILNKWYKLKNKDLNLFALDFTWAYTP